MVFKPKCACNRFKRVLWLAQSLVMRTRIVHWQRIASCSETNWRIQHRVIPPSSRHRMFWGQGGVDEVPNVFTHRQNPTALLVNTDLVIPPQLQLLVPQRLLLRREFPNSLCWVHLTTAILGLLLFVHTPYSTRLALFFRFTFTVEMPMHGMRTPHQIVYQQSLNP